MLPSRWTASITGQWRSGLPVTPVAIRIFEPAPDQRFESRSLPIIPSPGLEVGWCTDSDHATSASCCCAPSRASCTAGDALVPLPVNELQVALLPTDFASRSSPDAPLYALLAQVGSPLQEPLVRAERFEMTRIADGVAIDWQWL